MAANPRTSSTSTMVVIITTAMTTTMIASARPTRASSFCKGVVSVGSFFSMPAMRPISVCMPVVTTTALPWPYVAAVPLKTMLRRSPSPASSPIGRVSFSTGTLSPVSAASAVCSAVESISRASAGIVSPSSTRTTSPGTSSTAGTVCRAPSRMTWASIADIRRNAATACSARDCWT